MKFAKKFSNSVLRPIRPISWANWPWVVSHQVNIYSSSMYLGITTERQIFNSLFSCFACLYQSIIRHGCNGDAGIRTCDLCTFEGVWTIVDEGVFGMLTFSYRTFYSPHPGQLQGVKGTVSRDFLPFFLRKNSSWAPYKQAKTVSQTFLLLWSHLIAKFENQVSA